MDAVETLARCRHPDLALLGAELVAQPRDPVADPVELRGSHSEDRSSGMSPNLRMSFASPKSPVAGSPLRLNATALAILPVAFFTAAARKEAPVRASKRAGASRQVIQAASQKITQRDGFARSL